MRILLETSARTRPGADRGIGRYLDAVIDANALAGNDLDTLEVRHGDGRLSEFLAVGRRSVLLPGRDYDVFHAPTAYYSSLSIGRRPSVVSILDLIPLDVATHRRTGAKAELLHRLAARAACVLTLSDHAAGRIVERLGVDPARVVVAPLPAAKAFTPSGPRWSGTAGPYVAMLLDLRTPDPRKRASWLSVIAARLSQDGVALVVGGGGTDRLDIPGVHGLGRISDEEWAEVLRGASTMLYTSSYEGQGMPPLESIACGTPVVAMSNTAIPEVVGPAGILVDEAAGDEAPMILADRAARLALEPEARAALATEAAGQAARFTAERFSTMVQTAYRRAVDGR